MAQTFEKFAAEIRDKWAKAGRPACDHKRVEKDRFNFAGMDSGDRVCSDCGATWYLDNLPPRLTGPE